jgi:hypothetical protein
MHKQVNNRKMFAHWCTSERITSNVWELEHVNWLWAGWPRDQSLSPSRAGFFS